MRYEEWINEERWDRMIRYAADQFEEVTIMRGFQYYKQGRVEALQLADNGTIRAIVGGSEDYQVNVSLDKLAENRCGCPFGRPCKHIVAVLMAVAERAGRPVHALANAKTSVASLMPRVNPRSEGALRNAERLAPGLPHMSAAQWHEWFALCVEPLADHTRNPYYVKQAMANIRRWKPKLAAAEDRLFELNACLFLLSGLTSDAFLGYYTNIAASDVKEAALQCLREELPPDPSQRPRLLETAEFVRRRLLFKSPHSGYFSDLYFELWSRWISPRTDDGERLCGEELRLVEESADTLGADLNRGAWLTARSWLHLQRGEDREALELLNQAEWPAQGDVLRFLRYLAEAGEWRRLADWLDGCAGVLSGYRTGTLAEYSRLWDDVVSRLPEEEPRMWNAIAGLHFIYEEKLLAYGRWREWIDYQLSSGSDPLDFRVAELQPIEKADPEALLPFYHQAVERYVQLRNRDGYKQAVKLLKRLAKLYKKTKREERWALFFESFADRHSRLRALQEELRRGKLLS